MDALSSSLALLLLTLPVSLYFGVVAWAIGDVRRRCLPDARVVLAIVLLGPVGILAWLVFRPTMTFADVPMDAYEAPEEALSAATRLEMLSEWDAAAVLFRTAGERWPEHRHYAVNCLKRIVEKRSLA